MGTHDKSSVQRVPCDVPYCHSDFSRHYNYLRHLRVNHADSPVAHAVLRATRSATQGSASSAASRAGGSQDLL
jgi:hypothetical protein